MANDLGSVQFKASRYCALCRKGLPDPQHDLDQLPADGAWEYRVLVRKFEVSRIISTTLTALQSAMDLVQMVPSALLQY